MITSWYSRLRGVRTQVTPNITESVVHGPAATAPPSGNLLETHVLGPHLQSTGSQSAFYFSKIPRWLVVHWSLKSTALLHSGSQSLAYIRIIWKLVKKKQTAGPYSQTFWFNNVWDEALQFAFLTSCQVMLMLVVLESYFENQCQSGVTSKQDRTSIIMAAQLETNRFLNIGKLCSLEPHFLLHFW